MKLLEEETAKRLEEEIRKNVEEKLNSEEVKLEIERRTEEAQKKLFGDVAAQLEKEKEAALMEARQKEVRILDISQILTFLIFVEWLLKLCLVSFVFILCGSSN